MSETTDIAEKEQSFTKSILRTLLILDQFAASDELGIKDLSILTKLPASTVQRIVNTLESMNYLRQNPHTHKYRLGMAFFNLSGHYSNSYNWMEAAKIHMEKFVATHQETVNLAILKGYCVTYLAKIESPHILRPSFPVGAPFPACCTALGRCMLAYQKDIDLEEALSKIETPTEKTIVDPEALRQILKKVKENGYAMEDEEFQAGLFCIAAPVKEVNDKVIAAISTTIPKTRLDITKLPALIKDVMDTANAVTLDFQTSFQFS